MHIERFCLLAKRMDDTSVGPEKENVNDWREANLNNDNLVAVDEPPTHKYPFRQHYTGRTAGLSFMVDPELHEYHCSNIGCGNNLLFDHICRRNLNAMQLQCL